MATIRCVDKNENFNSSVLDSELWFYLLLYKSFPALFMVFVRGFIPLVDARLVKPLTVSRPRCTKNSDEQFNPSISWGLLRWGWGDSFASCLLCWCFIAWECLLLRPMGLGAYLASTVTPPNPNHGLPRLNAVLRYVVTSRLIRRVIGNFLRGHCLLLLE